jgi:hypothetical protein
LDLRGQFPSVLILFVSSNMLSALSSCPQVQRKETCCGQFPHALVRSGEQRTGVLDDTGLKVNVAECVRIMDTDEIQRKFDGRTQRGTSTNASPIIHAGRIIRCWMLKAIGVKS